MKLKSALLYLLWFIAAFVLFVFLLFPEKQAADYLSRSLTSKSLPIRGSIESVRPALPMGLKSGNLTLILGTDLQITPDYFKASLNLSSLFKAFKRIDFQSGLYQGTLNGNMRINSLDPFSASRVNLSMDRVKIKDFRYTSGLADIVLDCDLNGEYRQIETADKATSGQGTLLIQNLTAKLSNSLFNTLNLPVIDFSNIRLEYTHHGQTVTGIQCVARGSVINVKCNGKIDLLFPLGKSRLDLNGTILPDSPYLAKFANTAGIKAAANQISKTGINFSINGTLENPKIKP
jgi:type II secretion system protein N